MVDTSQQFGELHCNCDCILRIGQIARDLHGLHVGRGDGVGGDVLALRRQFAARPRVVSALSILPVPLLPSQQYVLLVISLKGSPCSLLPRSKSFRK
jgi:hypothetical protein